jgi:antitoxin YefM
MEVAMNNVSVNQFRDNLKSFVDLSFSEHQPLKVTRRYSSDFYVISAQDYEREQETLYILQNNSLMKQISNSLKTHTANKGYKPTAKELSAIISI